MNPKTSIYGVCVVQDEADVIRECLSWAARFCKRIRVWDLGSTDGTWEILQEMAGDQIQVFRKEGTPYSSSLRGRIAAEWRPELEKGAWIYILDADEFLVGDPGPILAAAEHEGASLVGVWQANFFPTRQTLADIHRFGESEWARQPLADRFRHYRVEWFEWRFVHMTPDLTWDTSGQYSSFRTSSGQPPARSHTAMVVRHYRYRSPQQVAKRFSTRTSAKKEGVKRFRYDLSGNFTEQVRPRLICRAWADPSRELVVPDCEIWRARFRMLFTRIARKLARMFHAPESPATK